MSSEAETMSCAQVSVESWGEDAETSEKRRMEKGARSGLGNMDPSMYQGDKAAFTEQVGRLVGVGLREGWSEMQKGRAYRTITVSIITDHRKE